MYGDKSTIKASHKLKRFMSYVLYDVWTAFAYVTRQLGRPLKCVIIRAFKGLILKMNIKIINIIGILVICGLSFGVFFWIDRSQTVKKNELLSAAEISETIKIPEAET